MTPSERLLAAADTVLAGRDPEDESLNSPARYARWLRAEATLPVPSATALAVADVFNAKWSRDAA